MFKFRLLCGHSIEFSLALDQLFLGKGARGLVNGTL